MQTPVFHLALSNFEGPLALLLACIERQKLPIAEVSLQQVTEQYLRALESLPHQESEARHDFYTLGTKLLYLKSQSLIPKLIPDAEDEEETSLLAQLVAYQALQQAMVPVATAWGSSAVYQPKRIVAAPLGSMPRNCTTKHLLAVLHTESTWRVVAQERQAYRTGTLTPTQMLQHRIERLRTQLSRPHTLSELLSTGTRSEVIVTFLALLEMVHKMELCIERSDHDCLLVPQTVSV